MIRLRNSMSGVKAKDSNNLEYSIVMNSSHKNIF